VSVVFLLVLSLAILTKSGWAVAFPYAYLLEQTLWGINLVLLIFNMLPIYPLDGGQILRALLWFLIGRARSLMVVTSFGFVGAAGLIAFAIWRQSVWTGLIAGYMLITCWSGWQQARILARAAAAEESGGRILFPEKFLPLKIRPPILLARLRPRSTTSKSLPARWSASVDAWTYENAWLHACSWMNRSRPHCRSSGTCASGPRCRPSLRIPRKHACWVVLF
jgi:hypothetical protein